MTLITCAACGHDGAHATVVHPQAGKPQLCDGCATCQKSQKP